MPITQNDTLNLAKIDERMRRKVYDKLIFSKFIGDMQPGEMTDNGQVTYKPSGSIIERLEQPVTPGSDHAIMTMKNDLEGDPIYGDTQAEGTGEEVGYNHMRVFINQTRKVIKARSGRMSEVRDAVYKVRENARPDLQNWFVRQENAHITQAIYEGASGNVTAGTATARNGIGLKKRLPSHVYYQSADGTFTIATGATANYNVTPTIMDNTAGQAMTPMTTKTIESAALLAQELKISRAIEEGDGYWIWFVSPYQIAYLRKNDTNWRAAEQAWATSKDRFSSPLAKGGVMAYGAFIFYESMQAVRPWNSDLASFAGTNGWRERGDYAAGEVHDVTYIMGKGCIGHAVDTPYHVEEQSTDFRADVEVEGSVINGWARNDFASSDDESSLFVKGSTTGAYITDEKEVFNYNLLCLMIDRA